DSPPFGTLFYPVFEADAINEINETTRSSQSRLNPGFVEIPDLQFDSVQGERWIISPRTDW
ncbi:hypothetical protein, partial [Sinorhizobium meliloti]|uniref:hypothetical protein n=1 Tax=Rhizobium meliloti TaxID=382 RepID=UPI001AED03F5